MNKELQSLKRIRKNLTRYRDSDDSPYLFPQDEIDLGLIESALKRNNKLEKENIKLMEENVNLRGRPLDFYTNAEKKFKALEVIKELLKIKIGIDESENDKSCGTVFIVADKDHICHIYTTFDEENIQKLKLLKEVLS